jgi:hypothetical protein
MPHVCRLSPGPSFLVIFSTVFLSSSSPSFSQLSLTVVDKKNLLSMRGTVLSRESLALYKSFNTLWFYQYIACDLEPATSEGDLKKSAKNFIKKSA